MRHPGRASALRALTRIAASALLVVVVAGCSGDEGDGGSQSAHGSHHQAEGEPTSAPSPEGKVLQPGKPGEPMKTLGPDATLPASQWNDADAEFMTMMIPHHAQALDMAKLAVTRASDPSVQAVADRISGAQRPEIVSMASWLQARGLHVPEAADLTGGESGEHGEHSDHGAMSTHGMLSDAQMRELAAADGTAFDRLFLAGMIQHHQGAVDMAALVLVDGTNLLVNEVASDISVGQAAEIDRMRDLQARI